MENGSKKQMVKTENGTLRALTEEEEAVIAENEEMEDYAAELMRQEEDKLQDDFTSEELREWECWAAKQSRKGPGVKRARVQVVVQGEGGRIIKKENWLVGLRDGEALAYSVSVQPQQVDEDDEPNPTAASSGEGASHEPDEDMRGCSSMEGAEPQQDGLLPVTGEDAPTMWNQPNWSDIKGFSVDDFMETPLASQFYVAWRKGEVTDSLIGRRFGYGVLGRFYGQKDWDEGTFEHEGGNVEGEDDERPVHAPTGGHAGGSGADETVSAGLAGGAGLQADAAGSEEADEPGEEHERRNGGGEGHVRPLHAPAGGHAGGTGADETVSAGLAGGVGVVSSQADVAGGEADGTGEEPSAALPSSTSERSAEPGSRRVEKGQTNLEHWLL